MTAPVVSIVIPTYNHAQYLRHALQSVLAQTFDDWECIVVNNFSTDDTESVVASLADPRLRLINFANQGVIAASRNEGIKAARGEWVAFLDSDDGWDADKLERCLAVSGDVDVVSHPEQFVRGDAVVHRTKVADPVRVTYETMLLKGNCLSPSAILVRRTLLDQLGGFCTDSCVVTAEDYDLWLRIARAGARFAFVDAPLALYRLHDGQNSGRILKHRDASLEVLRRHLAGLSWGMRLRGRVPCALAYYSAARSFQQAGQKGKAFGQWLRALALWPFHWKILGFPALLLSGR